MYLSIACFKIISEISDKNTTAAIKSAVEAAGYPVTDKKFLAAMKERWMDCFIQFPEEIEEDEV